MQLQVALDYFSIREALHLMEIIHPYVDIAEIGTPLMVSEGFAAIKEMKKRYPHISVLADMKIMDGGEPISDAAFAAGADIVTILGLTNDETVMGAVRAAHKHGKEICADTIGAQDLAQRTRRLEELGVHYVAVHTAHDMLGCISAPIDALKVIRANLVTGKCKSVISGGITPDDMPKIAQVGPDVVIVGSGLTTAKDPLCVARALKSFM